MAIINRDMDDGDVKNAILLSERLYAIDNTNPQYKFLYAKCLFQSLDYNATYTILKSVQSIPCLNLFAKSCLELGNSEESDEMQRLYWGEGAQALRLALSMNDLPQKTHWGDELASNTIRHHVPSKASLCNLLGDLYMKLDNIRAASIYYWTCLEFNPYKISAYMKLCDIAPDIDFSTAKLPQDIFTNFDPATTDLSRSSQSYLPSTISMSQCDISFSGELASASVRKNSWDMPQLRDEYHDTTVHQLRALVRVSSKLSEESNENLDHEIERGEIEHSKDSIIHSIKSDIVQMKANEAYKNKHGLHKKPPVQAPQKLKVDLTLNDENDVNYAEERKVYESIQQNSPPRLVRKQSMDGLEGTVHPKKRVKTGPSQQQKAKSLEGYFLPSFHGQYTNDPDPDALIIEGMNRIMKVLCILANGYLRQSFYNCEKAALELQQLDDRQYNSARVLCILGKAYYDAGDYTSARAFFKQAFVIAPWFCDCVPIYSTCLWYLEKEKELNLLAFKMKDNKSHLFEAYVAAGNWAKCVKGGNEATQWFQKAVNLDPSRSYGHALLGYEEWEKGNSLGAKQHFSRSMIANKRSYIGWYGMATAYQGMEEYAQARTLLTEAVRLHPRHPIVLATMAEVLCDLELYKEAFTFIERSLSIKSSPSNLKLKEKIAQRLQIQEAGNYV
ncbi:hypothetical protein MAM1_0216d08157 [Mucor ambiguus]|uniref:Uncharacterized protein n=1 Tax=Mucor ambiguus TaxID=91626 RepID=A0A0C9MYB0_9FUNG|nr:hypothetical protein MAM1_0216d08157 [Mucor ambiguus]